MFLLFMFCSSTVENDKKAIVGKYCHCNATRVPFRVRVEYYDHASNDCHFIC